MSSRSPSSVSSEKSASASAAGIEIKIGKHRLALPQHAAGAGMGVLHVEDRIVLALLDHLGEIEIERRVVLAQQHDEAHGVGADFIHDFAQASRSRRSASTF